MKAFEGGADGVLVVGCEEGSCHFQDGNKTAKRRVNYTKGLLAELNVEADRVRMVNLGAADARPFAGAVKDMVETVKKLGPAKYKKEKVKV
jgi:F420-non-reducing hydrogenase iron-sulfur subunit